MADRGRPTTTRRRNYHSASGRRVYVEGNTARRLQEVPDRKNPSRQQAVAKKAKAQRQAEALAAEAARTRQLSRQTQQNRERALNMGPGFVIFLSVVSAAVLFFCIHFLQLKNEVTAQMSVVASLESQLTDLKEENDAYESQVLSTIDLNEIKKIASGRLGMRYPTDEQKMTYETENSSYVRQYQDVPESGR